MTSAPDLAPHEGPRQPLSDAWLAHAPDLLVEVSPRGIEYVSPNVRTVLGYDPAALLGQAFETLAHPDDRLGLTSTIHAATAKPGRISVRRRLRHADGRTLWFEVAINAFDSTGGDRHVAVVARQVAYPIVDGRELETLPTTMDSLPEAVLPDPLLIIDSARRIVATNLAWRRLVFEGVPSVEGKTFADLVATQMDEVTAKRLADLVEDAFAGRTPAPVIVRAMSKTGMGWWQVQAAFAERGGFVVVSHEDVTALVESEQALQVRGQILEHSQKLALVGYWELSADGTPRYLSSRMLEIWGFPQGATPSVAELAERLTDSERKDLAAAAAAARNGNPPAPVRHRITRPDGSVRWVDHSFDIRPGTSGNNAMLIGVLKDVTNEVIALDAMRQSLDAIARSSEAIRESDERQRDALRIARASLWTWDRRTRTLWNSPALFEMLGYEAGQNESTPTKDLRHPDDLERAVSVSEGAIRRREPYTFRSRLRHADGRWLWVEERGTPVFAADGELVSYRGTTQDVDEQVQREEQLREALQIARASLWTWDRRTRTVWQSPDLFRMLGYEGRPEQYADRAALWHPDDRERLIQLTEDAIRQRQPYTIRYRHARADGGWSWIETRGVPIFDDRGELTGYRGTSQDVSAQVAREEQLHDALRIARASLWTWDRRTRTVDQSDDLYDVLGYESVPGGFDRRVALRHPDDREPSRRLSEEAVRRRQPYVQRFRRARADGSWAWIEERGQPVFDTSGELIGYQGTTQEVDEQVQREERLGEALRIARASLWTWDRHTRQVWQSDDLYRMFGHEGDLTDFNTRLALQHPDDQKSFVRLTQDAIRQRVPFTLRYRLAKASGGWGWVETRGIPQFDDHGDLIGYRGTTQDVSEQVEREEGLRRSEALLDEAERLTQVGAWSIDLDTDVEQWSDGMYGILGYAVGETTPSRDAIYARVHPDEQADMVRRITERLSKVREAGGRDTGSFRVLHPDGTTHYLSVSTERLDDEHGRPRQLLGVAQDVTAQYEAEALIRRNEERLRAVMESVGDGITLITPNGRNNWANEAFHRMVGYSSEELDAMTPETLGTALLDPTTVNDIQRWFRVAHERGAENVNLPRTYPMRLHRKDGSTISAEATISLLREGGTTAGLLSVIRDTTERDALREQLEAATLEINQILQTAALPIIVIEEDGTISVANQRTTDVFGWTPEELIGQDVSILSGGLNPTKHQEYIRHYRETGTASGPRGPMLGRTLEVVARHRDGHEFPVEVAVTEMVDPRGRRGYLGVVTDLTDRIRAQEELLRMQKSEALGTLVAGVAHDFNNLLTAMVGGIELAKAQPGEARWLDLAHEAADRAIRLVQQLLQFSRRSRVESQHVDPAALVERTTSLVRETFDRRVQVAVELPTVWGVIVGDEGQLQQVVMNLLLNARDAVLERADRGDADYTPSITVAIREDHLPAGRAVRIEVRDNGVGMTAEVRARAFDPFFTTKPVDRGTGLGLATVGGIVAHHHGEVTIDSAVDAGTVVTVLLPLVDTLPVQQDAGPVDPASPPSTTRTVLVIDDEEMVRAITAGYLEAADFRVVSMEDGNEAIRLLETTSDIDLVITDLNMPSPNGWEIIARLHGRPGIPPIVLASGYADEETALARGAAAFLHKPFTQADLLYTVKRLLDRE